MLMNLSQYEIARRSGFSRSTVSRVLSNHPGISETTRRKVKSIAEELGYQKNSLVSMLTAQLRASKAKSSKLTIAYLIDGTPESCASIVSPVLHRYTQGLIKRANELGYGVDPIYRQERGMTAAKIQNLLRARGIRGLLIGPRKSPLGHLSLKWENFAAVSVAHALPRLNIHYSTPAHFQNIGIALRKISKLGYRRIGFAVSQRTDRWASLEFSARYTLFSQETPPELRIPVFTAFGLDMEEDIRGFKQWFSLHRPEIIIHAAATIPYCMNVLGIEAPRDVALCDLMLPTNENSSSGIDQMEGAIAMAAVDLVVEQLHNNELGIPKFLKSVSIQGRWIAGKTTPKRT